LHRIHAVSFVLALGALLPAAAPASELNQLQTDDLQLVWFHPTEDYLAPHVARSFENSMDFQKRVFGWKPDGKVNVLLKDFGDYGNAGARSSPNNALIVDIAPLSFAFETFVASERMFSLMNHELVHVATLDQWTERERAWRELFGGKVQINPDHPETLLYHYLTTPRVVVPRWYMEGSAVFFETWMNGGLGRAQGAYDEMVFRAMVRDGARFYDPLGLAAEGTKVDFQVGVNNYLYGTRFFSYLGYRYSPEHVVRWVARTEGSERYYTDQFEEVFGKPMEEVWADWIAFEEQFQERNLAAVRAHPVSAHRRLSPEGLGSISRAYHEPGDDSMIAAFRYPGVAAFVGRMSLRDGSITPIVDVKGPMLYRVASLAYDPASGTAFYTTDNNSVRDIMRLDVRTGEQRLLFKDARIGDLALNQADRSLWGLRHLNGIVTLVRIPYPYVEFNQVHSWPYGEVLYDIDISPDGKLLSTSFAAINGDQSLRVMSTAKLLAGDTTAVAQFDFGSAVPDGFVFSPDGGALYGSSYYTGVSNIFRYDLATGKIEALSNAETGFFRPLPLPDGRLVAFDYTGQGFVPGFIDAKPLEDLSAITFLGAKIAEEHPIVRSWKVPSPGTIDLAARTRSQGDYESFREIGLQSYYPVVEGYKDTWAAGLHFNFADPIGLDQLKLTLSYSPDEALSPGERLHFEARYKHRNLHLGFRYNDADFYDLFGPKKRSRRGTVWTVGYDVSLIYDKPEIFDLKLELEAFNNLDTLPGYQNVAATTDQLVTASAGFDYSYIINSLGNVDDEKGVRWDLNLVTTVVDDRTIPAVYGRLAAGLPFLFDHSTVWLRTAFGASDGADADPFANFFFGSFGNNWVDKRDAKAYRNHFSFPGFEIDEVGGRTFARAMLEWNLPPLRFRSFGTPANYLSWARPALFASVLVANPESPTLRREVRNLGAQLDLQFYVMHSMDMTLSFGYALGFEDGVADREEFMASLKVLY
jgi:hypothetical protein